MFLSDALRKRQALDFPSKCRNPYVRAARRVPRGFALLRLEQLEDRVTPTGSITITNALVVDGNNNPISAVTAGEWVYIQADFTTQNLPSNASYRVGLTVNGLTLDSSYITWGAGNPGTGFWDLYWGTFLATPGTNQVTAIVDPDHNIDPPGADNTLSFTFDAAPAPAGTFISYTAAQMRNAYGVNSIPNFGSAAADGSGQTIAIINGGNDPTVFADVDGFDQAMSLTTSSTETISQQYGAASSFLTVYNQNGVNITQNIANSGSNGVPVLPSGSEESWDIEWAHAMAPGAKIDEIEFDPTGNWGANLLTSYATAATLPNVSAANWSGGLSQWSTESSYDTSVFVTPSGHVGVTFVCPSNDNGANVYPAYGEGDGYYPSTSPNVVSVGGTHLNLNNDGYGSETGWSFPTPTTTVDNGSASFSQAGSWSSQAGGFGGTYSTATAGSSSTATWTIPISSTDTGWGTELSATWVANSGNATNATYTVYDGTAATGTVLGTISLNQTQAPAGTADGSAQFQELGVFFPTLNASGNGTLTVVLNAGSANATVVADAIGAAPAWASTGGPAQFESEPAYQAPFQSTGYRTTPDVSFDADFSADGYGGGGLTYGGGGTSLGGPCWTGLFAIVNQGRVAEGGTTLNSPTNPQQALQAIYRLPDSDFHDITTGYNGFFDGPGYDMVTGRGTPIANLLIPDLVSYGLTPTDTSLTDNGISAATAGGSVEAGYSISFTVTVAGPTTPTGTVQLEDAANGNALVGSVEALVNGTVTFTVAATAANNLGAGTHQLFAVYIPAGALGASQSAPVAQVVDSTFEVQTIGTTTTSNFSQTATGFVVVFNAVVNTSALNLYGMGAASLSFVTGTTPVAGSLVFDSTGTTATFVATGTFPVSGIPLAGILSAGASYSVDLSGTNASAFQDSNGHVLGSSGGTGGVDFTGAFTSTNSATSVTVSVPYFARGYSQSVNVLANTTNGLPISINVPTGATTVTSASFDLFYDPTLLTVTGGTIASGFSGTIDTATVGQVHVNLTSISLPAGSLTNVVNLTASVPSTAPYRNKEVLQIRDVSINGGANNGQAGSAVHAATFLDATQGPSTPSTYSAQDAFNILKAAAGLPGAIYNKLLDPTIVADDAGMGRSSAQNAFDVSKKAVGLSVPLIPDLPSGGTPPPVGGPDPYLYLDPATRASVGSTVTVRVNLKSLQPGGFTFDSSDMAISFDPTKLQISNVRAGSYVAVPGFGSSLFVVTNVDNQAGKLFISEFTTNANGVVIPDGTTGDVVQFDVTILSGVAGGATVLKLNADIAKHFTVVNGGQATLSPAPDNSVYKPLTDDLILIGGQSAGPSFLFTGVASSNPETALVIGPDAAKRLPAMVVPGWYFSNVVFGSPNHAMAAHKPDDRSVNEANAFWTWLGSTTSGGTARNPHANVLRSRFGPLQESSSVIGLLEFDYAGQDDPFGLSLPARPQSVRKK